MPITNADIKLRASERMTDTTDGGGRRTSNVIPDGASGNIFPKVSRLDSVYGKVNLRKVYGHVDTDDTDTYAGTHAAIIDAADNNRIHVTLFSTGSDFDTRAEARDRIESFVIAGPESRMVLYGRQLIGQRAVVVYQGVAEPLPDVGSVWCLSNEPGGVTGTQQYVRVEDVTHEVRTFEDDRGEFQRRVVTLATGNVLRYEFVGRESVSRFSSATRSALMRSTTVVDAARYFGITPVAEAAAADALEMRLASIFAPIVPTTQREVAVSNAAIEGGQSIMGAAVAKLAFHNVGYTQLELGLSSEGFTQTFNLSRAVQPGTFEIRVPNGGVATTDNGEGVIPASANVSGKVISGGTIDYETGVVTVTGSWGGVSNGALRLAASYVPAVSVTQPAHTKKIDVTLATRGTVYVQTLSPLPAPGTAFVDYRALGKWYRLRDDGTGALVGGDVAYGTGTLDLVTGSLVVTLGALPDVGSAVITGWASPAHYSSRAGATSDADTAPHLVVQLEQVPVKPGTLSLSYLGGVTTYTATADSNGVITGGGVTGTVNHGTGEVDLVFATRFPNHGTSLTIDYEREEPDDPGAPTTAADTATLTVGSLEFTAVEDIAAKGFRISLPVLVQAEVDGPTELILIPAVDDGTGVIKSIHKEFEALDRNWRHLGGTSIGTINYGTGEITLGTHLDITRYEYRPALLNGNFLLSPAAWIPVTRAALLQDGDYPWSARITAANTGEAFEQVVDPQVGSGFRFDLTDTITAAVVPGSVVFDAFGRRYFDRVDGLIYMDIQADGTALQAGSIDYATGEVTFRVWVDAVAPAISVVAALTQYGTFTMFEQQFRTAGSPVRPASTIVSVTATDGTVLTATSDVNGELTGTLVEGQVNQEMGVVSIRWGELVTAAGNEEEPWYDADLVVGSQIWKPREVFPNTLRYSTVVLSNLPLNADILGLDPTRLPSDGRVPIFREGDVVLIHNTKTTAIADPAVAGATYSMGRTNLADLVLRDAEGTLVPTSKWAVNLATGVVTMAADLDLTGYEQPLVAKHRIEQLNLATDVQINGEISLSAPLSRAFDEDTLVSSALLFGDLFARATNLFDQVTWTGVWSDSRIGSDATGVYNSIDYPIEVKNSGAVTDRWRIHFTTSSAFQVISENLGVIATGSTGADCSPVNPLTGEAYFMLRAAGWGAGWAVGNNFRFNTVGATAAIWMARTVLPGATLSGDSIDIQLRGDVDA